MELADLAEIVDNMIVQHDYPGFEVRGLKLGLPEEALKMHAKVFVQALGHESIYVKLAALRWLQERPGVAKSYMKPIAGLLDNSDEWVRMEAVRTLERISSPLQEAVEKIADLLRDDNVEVRKTAAKALGKICSRKSAKSETIVKSLHDAASDQDAAVRWKVQKALRQIGEYDS
ncbi:MAG: HEAT repeat domain-containing protein [Cyanobacteria bacterium SZAS-4]|nr:HEAT repeat domain-containing protein [Cyanobacteria bacterium SZAS-4]